MQWEVQVCMEGEWALSSMLRAVPGRGRPRSLSVIEWPKPSPTLFWNPCLLGLPELVGGFFTTSAPWLWDNKKTFIHFRYCDKRQECKMTKASPPIRNTLIYWPLIASISRCHQYVRSRSSFPSLSCGSPAEDQQQTAQNSSLIASSLVPPMLNGRNIPCILTC